MQTDPRGEREAARIVATALRQDASAHEAGALEARVPVSDPVLVSHFERIERPTWLGRLFGRGPA